MSFDSEFWELQKTTSKKKKKKDEEEQKKLSNKPYAQKLIESDLAPHKIVENNVKSGFTSPLLAPTVTPSKKTEEEDEEWYKKIFKKPELFDDGFQASDIPKTILGTAGDLALGVLSGAGNFVEGITDTIGYGVADVSEALGAEDFANATRERVKKNTIQQVLGKPTEKVDKWSVLDDTADSVAQGLGMIATLAAGGAALGAAGLGAGATTAITTGATGLSGFGSGMSEAYQGGATEKEAKTYGAIVGASEALSELLFGGLGKASKALGFSKGLSGLDDMAAKKVANMFSSQFAKNLAEYGVKSGAEGAEEVISGIAQIIGKKITYMSEEELGKIWEDENLLEQFVIGSVTSSFAQASGLHKATKTGTDFITGLKENEQTVVDKVVESRIAELEEKGEKVTNKTKNKIYDEVIEDLDKGYLDTEQMESLLGGEDYEKYKAFTDKASAYEAKLNEGIEKMQQRHDELQAEYDKLNELDLTKAKLGDHNRQNEIKDEMASLKEKIQQWNAELEAYTNDEKTNELKTNLKTKVSQSVYELVKDSRLGESYREIERSKQKFEADTSKYKNENARQTVQNAIDSGLFRNSNADHDAVDFITKVTSKLGLVCEFTNNEKITNDYIELQTQQIAELEKIPEAQRTQEQINELAKMKDALAKVQSGKLKVNGNTTKGVITINLDSVKPVEFITGHEVLHNLIKSKAYKNGDLHKAFKSYLGKKEYARRLEEVKRTYEGNKTTPDEELVANLVGEYIFNDYDFVMHLATNNRNIFQQAWDSIKHLYKMATAGSKEARDLERVKRTFEKAYREAAKSGAKVEGVKHSLIIKHTDGSVEEISDARALTNEQAVNYLNQAQKGILKWNSYIPVRKDTPQVIIDTLNNAGVNVKNLSLVMQVRKAQQSMSSNNKGGKHGNNVRRHALSPEKIVEIANNLDKPTMVILQTNRYGQNGEALPDNVAVFVEYNNNNNEGMAVIEFESSIDKEFIGTESGDTDYHTVVTIFEPDTERYGMPFDYAEELLSNPNNYELQIEKKQPTLSAIGKKHPNTSNELLFKDILSQNSEKSSGNQYSLSETDNKYLSAVESGDTETAQKMVDEAAKENGYTEKVYHGTQKFGFTTADTSKSDDKLSFFATNEMDTASTYSAMNGTRKIGGDVSWDDVDNAIAELEDSARESAWELADAICRWAGYYGAVDSSFIYDKFKNISDSHDKELADSFMYELATDVLNDLYNEDYHDGMEFYEWQETEEAEKLYTEVNRAISKFLALSDFESNAENVGNYELYANTDNMLVIEGNGDRWNNLTDSNLPDITSDEYKRYGYRGHWDKWTTRSVSKYASDLGYDGVIFRNIIDDGGKGTNSVIKPADVYSFFKPQTQVKSADTITYDDNGNVVPLSERFKAENNDIRYSLSEEEAQETNAKLNNVGLKYDNRTVSYSLSSLEDAFNYKNESDYLKARNEYVDALAKSIATEKGKPTREEYKKADRYLDSLFLIHDMIAADKDRLDYEAAEGRKAWVGNVEYGGSIDFSTLCAKRRLFTGTFDAIQNALPDTVLTDKDFLNIRKLLLDHGEESPCSMCYVEGSRAKHGVYVDKWLKEYLKTNPEWKPQIADFTSTTRLEQTRIQHPEAYKEYVKAMNKLSQRKPKEASVRTDYKGEILDAFKNGESVEQKNLNGGIRFNSFSDFEIIHALDCMQVLTDMARVGLNGQAYTKVKEFAEAFGNTGLKINLSLVAKDVDANGNLVMDEVNGMNYTEAKDIRERYSDNVGTVIVVFNDAQLKAALADNTIDFVLPFHRSQWRKAQYTLMGLPDATRDYTNIQNDRYKNPKTGRPKKAPNGNIMPNEYWDFTKSGRENAQKYLDYINENSYIPKFDFLLNKVDGKWVLPNDAVGDGYFKLLIDFKMYNNEGVGSPQNPVLPEFNMPYIQQMLNNYVGGHQAFPVAHDVVNEFVEGKKNGKYSLSDDNGISKGYATFYGRKIANRNIPLADIAPVKAEKSSATVSKTEKVAPTVVQESVAPAPTNGVQNEATPTESNATEEKPKRRSELHQSIVDRLKGKFTEKGFDFDDVLNKAKNLSTIATVDNIPQRVMEKALGYKQGQILADETVNKVAQNESEGIKWLNSFTDRKNGVLAQISKQYNIKPGSKKSAAAQMYAEGFYVDKNNEIIKYGDRELAIDFPDVKVQENIKGLARDPRIRKIYDDTLNAINESRSRNLYPEIPRLDNYFLHFRAMEDTFSQLGLPFNPNDIRAKDLPTDLNGVTADLKPGQPYFASAKHREGMRTSFDLLGGLERYLSSAKNQIYHIDDIQTLRALRNYIADTYGQAKGLESLDDLTDEEAQYRIEQVYSSHLSTFAKFLNEEANVLAGKTTLIDRGLEGVFGRKAFTFFDTLNKQVGSNMVGWNISSSLTNFLPVAQTFAKTNKFDFTKAFAQTVSSKIGSIFGKTDSFVENNPTIIRRKGAERFNRTFWQKMGDTGYVLMGAVDDISTELIVRTKYNELIRKGMDEQKASFEADKWVSRLMGDRSLGQQPQLYNSKGLGLLTKFQLEVRNQLDSQFYDTIQEAKVSNEEIENKLLKNAKTAAKVTSVFFQLAAVQHLYGMAFESIAGYNPAFDIIDVLIKTLGFDDDEEDEDTPLDNIGEGFLTLLEDLPYTSIVTGGRIPFSSALPSWESIKQIATGEDEYGNKKSRVETFTGMLNDTVPYYVLPTGYGQLKKTAKGLKMFSDEHPVAGSYTDSGNLRFPVEDTPLNRVQAAVFGQYANKNARTYFDEDYAPLKENQIKEYAEAEMPIADYWKYREGLKDFTKQDEKAAYINGLDISKKQKDVLKSYLYDEEGYKKENPEKYAFLEREGIGYLGYKELDEDTQSAWSWAFKHQDEYEYYKENGVLPGDYSTYYIPMLEFEDEDDEAYQWSFDNPEKATVGKVFGEGVKEYRQYAKDLNEIKADKDENGKSISGSAKEKKKAYIWSLPIDYGQKIILYRSLYDSKDDKAAYNQDILDYLFNREDLTYEEVNTICEELGFTVNRDTGYISWD